MAEKPRWTEVLKQVLPGLAASGQPLLIVGEVGSGRATLATRIHNTSGRTGPCLIVSCSEASAAILTARFASAAGGSLCLRDLELLPVEPQAELLRLLTEPGSVRVLATAAPNIKEHVAAGRLRSDLWSVLQASRLDLPPLRERMDELPELVTAILAKPPPEAPAVLSAEAKAALLTYRWPLNLRELREILAQAIAAAGSGQPIGPEHLPADVTRAYQNARGTGIFPRFQNAVEKTLLLWCLADFKNRSDAATALGLSRAGFYKQLNRHGLLDDHPPAKGKRNPRSD